MAAPAASVKALERSPKTLARSHPGPPPLATGSFWGGFVGTALFGLLALAVVYVTSKEPETRRGARMGFLARIGFIAIYVAVMIARERM